MTKVGAGMQQTKRDRDTRQTRDGTAIATPPEHSSKTSVCHPLTEEADVADLARIAKALSDPIRLHMLQTMSRGRGCCGFTAPSSRGVPGSGEPEGICVCEFQEQFNLGQSKTSYHLRVLKEAGLISEETRGRWAFYTIDRAAVERVQVVLRELFSS